MRPLASYRALMSPDNAQSGGVIVRYGQSDGMTSIGGLGRSGRFFLSTCRVFLLLLLLPLFRVRARVSVRESECTYVRVKI